MTDHTRLIEEVLTFLGSYPQKLKANGHDFAGKLAVQLGNAILTLSYNLEREQPQLFQPLEEAPRSLYALGKQFREVGLSLWDAIPPVEMIQCDPWKQIDGINATLYAIVNKLEKLEKSSAKKGGAK